MTVNQLILSRTDNLANKKKKKIAVKQQSRRPKSHPVTTRIQIGT